MKQFQQWFEGQNFYTNMRFIYGDGLFDMDGDVYRVLPVQIAYKAWQDQWFAIDKLQKRIDKVLPFLDRAYKFTKSTSCCLAILDAKGILRGEL